MQLDCDCSSEGSNAIFTKTRNREAPIWCGDSFIAQWIVDHARAMTLTFIILDLRAVWGAGEEGAKSGEMCLESFIAGKS